MTKFLYTLAGFLTSALCFAAGYLTMWYRVPMSPPLCLSGLPPQYEQFWGAIWQVVRLGGIVGLVLLAGIFIMLIIIAAKK